MTTSWDNSFVAAAGLAGSRWLVRAMQAGALARIADLPASAGEDAGMDGDALHVFAMAYDSAQAIYIRPDGGWEAVAGYIIADGNWTSEPIIGDGICYDPRTDAADWLAGGMTQTNLGEWAAANRRAWAKSMDLWECGVVARLCGAARDEAERIDPDFRPAWTAGWDWADGPGKGDPVALRITADGWTFG